MPGAHSATITEELSRHCPMSLGAQGSTGTKRAGLVTGPQVPAEGQDCFHEAGGSCGAGRGWVQPRSLGRTHPCRAGSWKRSMQNCTKAFRSVLLIPPMGLMSALEQSYLVR